MNQLENNYNSAHSSNSYETNMSNNNLQSEVVGDYMMSNHSQKAMLRENGDQNFSLVRSSSNDDVQHRIALKALQDEIAFHQRLYDRETYLDKALSYVYDGGRSESLHKLETAYQNEVNQTSHVDKTQLKALLQSDQHSLTSYAYVDTAVGLTGTALATFGGPAGRLAAGTLLMLNSVHTNDSLGKQALEALGGFGLGSLASTAFLKGMNTSNPYLSLLLRCGSYPLASTFSRTQFPSDRSENTKPDLDQISSEISAQAAEPPEQSLTPKLDGPATMYLPTLELNSKDEWSEFDVLK